MFVCGLAHGVWRTTVARSVVPFLCQGGYLQYYALTSDKLLQWGIG